MNVQVLGSNKLKISSPIWLIAYIKNEISLYYPIDNRNGNKKEGLIRAYFVYSFYNVEKDEKIHFKNGAPLLVKRDCYTTKDIEKVSSGKVKYDSLTGKSVIDPTTDNILNGKPSDVLYTGYLNKDISFGDIVYFEPNNIQYKKLVNGIIDELKVSLVDGDCNEILSNFKISIVLHII